MKTFRYIITFITVVNMATISTTFSEELYNIGIKVSLNSVLAEYPELPAPKCYHEGPKSFTLMQNAYRASVQSLEHRLQAAKIAKNMTLTEKADQQNSTRQNQPEICKKLSDYNVEIRKELVQAKVLDDDAIYQLKLAYSEATKEAKLERKKYINCISKLTTDAFRAYERVRFFSPRMVASGSLERQDEWVGTIERINSKINEVKHSSGNDFEESLKSFNEASNQINELIANFNSGLYDYPQNISSKMAIGWACGTASIAATALLSWTRVPNEVSEKSFDQVKDTFALIINNAFSTVKSACAFQTGGFFGETEVESKLANSVSSWGECNEWIESYQSTAVGCLSFKEYSARTGADEKTTDSDNTEKSLNSNGLEKILELLNSIFNDVSTKNRIMANSSNSVNRKLGNEYEAISLYRTIYITKLKEYAEHRSSAASKAIFYKDEELKGYDACYKGMEGKSEKSGITPDVPEDHSEDSGGDDPVTNFIKSSTDLIASLVISIFDSAYAVVMNSTRLISTKLSCLTGNPDPTKGCSSMSDKINDWASIDNGLGIDGRQIDLELSELTAKLSDELQTSTIITDRGLEIFKEFKKHRPYINEKEKEARRELGVEFFGDENAMALLTKISLKKFEKEAELVLRSLNLVDNLTAITDSDIKNIQREDDYVTNMYNALKRKRDQKRTKSNYVLKRSTYTKLPSSSTPDNLVEEYDYGDALICTDKSASLFQIISNRYKKKMLWKK